MTGLIPQSLDGETWLPVPGYEGSYEVSDKGSARSVDRTVRNGHGLRPVHGRVLRPRLGNGYLGVSLRRGNQSSSHHVHILVASAFIGMRQPGMVVCHADGDRLNNAAPNLRYDTQRGNCRDTVAHGRSPRGVRNNQAKLTDEEVRVIRAARGTKTTRALASEFGVSHSTICQVQTGDTWRHLHG